MWGLILWVGVGFGWVCLLHVYFIYGGGWYTCGCVGFMWMDTGKHTEDTKVGGGHAPT